MIRFRPEWPDPDPGLLGGPILIVILDLPGHLRTAGDEAVRQAHTTGQVIRRGRASPPRSRSTAPYWSNA